MARIEAHARKHPKKAISDIVRDVFPELAILEASERHLLPPRTPPAKWPGAKHSDLSPVEFVKLHYAPWLGKGLTRADLLVLDPALYRTLRGWIKKHGLPEDLDLPSLPQSNTRKLEALAGLVGGYDELSRLGQIAAARGQRDIGKW